MKTFLLIVLGQIISLFGNAALRFALPLYLLRQTGSATLYGLVTAAAMLPALLGTLAGGILADRFPKAKIMAVLDAVATLVSIFSVCAAGYLPAAVLVLFALGTLYALQGLYQPAVRASLPLLLDSSRLLQANAFPAQSLCSLLHGCSPPAEFFVLFLPALTGASPSVAVALWLRGALRTSPYRRKAAVTAQRLKPPKNAKNTGTGRCSARTSVGAIL